MLRCRWASLAAFSLALVCVVVQAGGQTPASAKLPSTTLSVVDENGIAVPDAQVQLAERGQHPVPLRTDYAGRCGYSLHGREPYQLMVEKPGFYQTLVRQVDPTLLFVTLVLAHQQMIRQEVNVVASTPGIDPEQTSDASIMNTPEIVNIPYPTSRDIRTLLPFNPGVVQDTGGQPHVAGSQTYATLDLLDGFDIRSPVSGMLAMRVSADAVRSIDVESTRYPVEFGKATGGVISFATGMGDNKFRFNATDFFPSYRAIAGGVHFDKFVPRVTFSGPLLRSRAWFYDGLEAEYDNIIIPELPSGADSDQLLRGSNLIKIQGNPRPRDILIGGLLFNDYHSPYSGLSPLTPQQSTTNEDILAWMPYVRDQHSFAGGALLDLGAAVVHFRNGSEPHGAIPFEITPEVSLGSYFQNLTSYSRRVQGTAALYLPPYHLAGRHDWKAGLDLDQIAFGETVARTPIHYLREDGTLLRMSTFPAQAPFARDNFEAGGYLQDRWLARTGLLIEPGIRFDWDEIVRRPLYSPRLAGVYSPKAGATTKISAGAGLYYEHTELQYLEEALAGGRDDIYYAADGITPVSPPLPTNFVVDQAALHEPRALNWSLGLDQKLPASLYASVSFLDRLGSGGLVYANQSGPSALSGTYLLTNSRRENYHSVNFSLRRSFTRGYTLFGSYTRSSASTNAALEYSPALSVLGPQQSGPLPWDTPNRVISWGWLPVPILKSWDFVYTADWRTGFPFISVNANQQVVGTPGSKRFPDYFAFSPGLEWRFHFRGSYFGLRGVMENITGSQNPAVVNNVVDSPQYGMFTVPEGRGFTARIRLIGSK